MAETILVLDVVIEKDIIEKIKETFEKISYGAVVSVLQIEDAGLVIIY